MQTVEHERREDDEDDFTVVDQHGKVYNDNAGMDGIVVQIDIRDYVRMPDVLKDKLLRRLTGGYEVVAPPVDRYAIPDLRTSELFYDRLARVIQLLSQPGWLQDKSEGGVPLPCKPESFQNCCQWASKAHEIANFFVSNLDNLPVNCSCSPPLSVEFPGRWYVPCFFDRRTTKSLREIIHAMYPSLRFEGRQAKADRGRNTTKHTFSLAGLSGYLDVQVSREELSDSCRYSFTFQGTYFWVKHQQQERENLEEIKVRGLLLTLAMGMHNRLGAGSHLKLLRADVFHEIGRVALKQAIAPTLRVQYIPK